MPKWVAEGKIKDLEYIVKGLPNAGQCFVDMMVSTDVVQSSNKSCKRNM